MQTTESGGVALELTDEKVTFIADTNSADRFLPRIAVAKSRTANGRTTIEKNFRPFEAVDMTRVLDYNEVPDPPEDTTMRVAEDAGTDGLKFPVRNVCVRGGYLFYFDVEDVDDHVNGHYVSYHAPPLGVVSLDKVDIATPQGGRRVFREHAHTDARQGYEFVLVHAPDGGTETTRPAAFFVAESLAQREKWLKALRLRAELTAETKLRPNVSARRGSGGGGGGAGMGQLTTKSTARRTKRNPRRRAATEDDADPEDAEARDVDMAKREFGVQDFGDESWLNNFFMSNNDFEAGNKIDQLEQWQSSIKRGLRGAVLEQYEYFVEASGEMTTMGKEVSALKTMVETQNFLIKEMKEIDFTAAFAEGDEDDPLDSDDEDAMDPPNTRTGGRRARRRRRQVQNSDDEEDSSISSDEEGGTLRKLKTKLKSGMSVDIPDLADGLIEIPSWLEDVGEEISAFIKECRYTDATDLLFKARDEVNEIVSQHDRPTEDVLTKKQHANMLNMLSTLEALSERMSNRLVEGLRRKNEAFKQAGKRERSDPLSLMAPMVSPCCLGDDSIPLHLLVKLGKTQEAATAYAARRSLLLLESLHERPISGSGNVDLVIYAAQLSQSFFCCLAGAVEGFLDLFLVQPDGLSIRDEDTSSILSQASRNVPPGALASIVLWCDSELSKFSSAFGGTRILGNLALSPPPKEANQSKMRMVGFEEEGIQSNKERENAIDVAAQCVDQAFTYASENLDSIGLPLTPRLAEYIRSRLKGCESEVSKLLNSKWKHVTFEWEIELDEADIPMDEGRRFSSQQRTQESTV